MSTTNKFKWLVISGGDGFHSFVFTGTFEKVCKKAVEEQFYGDIEGDSIARDTLEWWMDLENWNTEQSLGPIRCREDLEDGYVELILIAHEE